MNNQSSLLNKLASMGGDYLWNRWRADDEITLLRKSLIKNDEASSVIFSDENDCHDKNYFLALKFACEQEISLIDSSFWSREIESTLSEIPDEDDDSYLNFYRNLWSAETPHIYAAKLTPNYNWKKMFLGVWSHQVFGGYVRNQFLSCLDAFANSDNDSFVSFAKDNVFWNKGEAKPGYDVRSRVYHQYVKIGALDKKTARKIRSDGSEDASVTGLKSLLENLDLYDNSDELLLQFTDSKYESVIFLLADNLPEYLLASIMGTEFYAPKKRIEQRLEEIERSKASNEELGEV